MDLSAWESLYNHRPYKRHYLQTVSCKTVVRFLLWKCKPVSLLRTLMGQITIAQLQGHPSRWWNWRLALLKPFSYQFYWGHVSCCYTARPRRALGAKGTEVCLDPESPWPAGQRPLNSFARVLYKVVWFPLGGAQLSVLLAWGTTLVAGRFLTISWETSGLLLVLHDTSSLWVGCFWAAWLSMMTKVKCAKLFAQSSSHHGFKPGQQKLNSPRRINIAQLS